MRPPPLLVSFRSPDQFLAALKEEERTAYSHDLSELLARGFPPVASARCVATLFGFSSLFVGALVRRPERYYRTFTVPKGRGQRTINAPRVALKVIQSWIGHHLSHAVSLPDCVFGFVKGRSAVAAAAIHCPARWVLTVDIESFFRSTPHDRVTETLRAEGFPDHAAQLTTKLCCFEGALAQGSPASPVLSNMVLRQLDGWLITLAAMLGVRYTRYADDLVFSGEDHPPSGIVERVLELVEGDGWKASRHKTALRVAPQRLKVHGLVVSGGKPRLTKGYRNRLRAYSHLLAADRIREEDLARVRGHLAYGRSVEPANW